MSAASGAPSANATAAADNSEALPTAMTGVHQIDLFAVPHLSTALPKGAITFQPNVFVRTRVRRALTTPITTPAAATASATVASPASPTATATTGKPSAAAPAQPPATPVAMANAEVSADDEQSVVLYDVVRNVAPIAAAATGGAAATAVAAAKQKKADANANTKPAAAAAATPAVDTKAVDAKANQFASADGKGVSGRRGIAFLRAGPRPTIVWQRGEVKAAIVTCGGLCPGLNDVISELVNVLYFHYGVDTIFGVRNGFRGFYEHTLKAAKGATGAAAAPNWQLLTPANTRDIHLTGGTVLGSSRGGFDAGTEAVIIDECVRRGINQLYAIGGDGTHRAVHKLAAEALRRARKMTVCAVPKTVDNDVACIDKSFGFETAVSEAVKAIRSAAVEARCCPNGIGLVTLMGRTAGHIAANATLASREVDLVLVPEVPFALTPVLQYIHSVVQAQGHAVVVVAEGAGLHLLPPTGKSDASGNRALPEIGRHLQHALDAYFAGHGDGSAAGTKYHDPSYMIRSGPCNAADTVMCAALAHGAVHAAMHGFTAFSSGTVNNRTALIPLSVVANHSPALLNPNGRTWERVLATTQQPTDLTVELGTIKSQL